MLVLTFTQNAIYVHPDDPEDVVSHAPPTSTESVRVTQANNFTSSNGNTLAPIWQLLGVAVAGMFLGGVIACAVLGLKKPCSSNVLLQSPSAHGETLLMDEFPERANTEVAGEHQ